MFESDPKLDRDALLNKIRRGLTGNLGLSEQQVRLSGMLVLYNKMGWLNISLDLMTITIAAIIIGIAVDDTIHYVHRYMHEFRHDQEYWPAIKRSHASIGRALLHNVDHHTGFLDPCAFQFCSNHLFRAAYRARHDLRADRRLDATAPIERLLQTPRLPGDARAWLSSSEDRSKIMLTLSQWYNDLQRVELRLQTIASKQPAHP
jgi:hypothetical protein